MIAFAVVLGLMIYYYYGPGLLANLALLLNLVLLLGVLSWFEAVLTLPGIAGVVLTVGMAVDANILIFDRIREERDKGRNVKQAAKSGFENATSAILDANITTFLTALILYNVGTGPVRGFAVTLMIGILTSVFAALVITRVLVHLQLEKRVPSFRMGSWLASAKYDFAGKWKLAMTASVIATVGGVVFFIALPDSEKLGIDFLGGASVKVRTEAPEPTERVRELGIEVYERAEIRRTIRPHESRLRRDFRDCSRRRPYLRPGLRSNGRRARAGAPRRAHGHSRCIADA